MQVAKRIVAAAIVAVAAGCSSTGSSPKAAEPTSTSARAEPPVWPAPSAPLNLTRAAGLEPETAESLQFHVHAHLDVFVDGQEVTVPAGLGIDIDNPGVHVFDDAAGGTSYGGIDPPCASPCISPLHTHDVTGIIHTESATRTYNTLGQLFTEWGLKLDENCVSTYCAPETDVAIYVKGRRFTGDPRTIELTNLEEIAIVIGAPPAEIPAQGDFSAL
jgi:hypothetical protein